HGWFLDNPALNAPEGLNFRDVPTSDNNFYLVLIKLLGLLTTNYALISNLLYLLSFPLTTGLALYVWRHFGLSRPVALSGSLLYSFLPFHFWRGQNHIFLASYYLVPLAVMLVLWVCLRRLSWGGWRKQQGHLLAGLVICLLLGSTGYYYAFFTCFLLFVAGVIAWVEKVHWRGVFLPSVLLSLVGC